MCVGIAVMISEDDAESEDSDVWHAPVMIAREPTKNPSLFIQMRYGHKQRDIQQTHSVSVYLTG